MSRDTQYYLTDHSIIFDNHHGPVEYTLDDGKVRMIPEIPSGAVHAPYPYMIWTLIGSLDIRIERLQREFRSLEGSE